LPGPEPKTETIEVDRRGTTSKKFELRYAILDLTNAEPDARLLYQNQAVATFPARLHLKPDTDYNFVVDYGGGEIRSNLPVRIAASRSYTPAITFPDLRRLYTNSVGMVLVRVNKNLYVGRFEATEEEYLRVMGRAIESKPRGPVVNVKWDDAVAFCQKLTAADTAALEKGRLKGWTYGLPTDAEWAKFAENDPAQLAGAVFSRLEGPLEIDPFRMSSNRVSLFDLFGNVAEWCLGANNQPMTIGGAHNRPRPRQFPEDHMRITDATRLGASIAEGSPAIGFRCVLRAP
jgi:formylglycine-generating enzyme required for sulfatase activity